MGFKLSIDPSINTTGLCLWRAGKIVDHMTTHAPAKASKDNLILRVNRLLVQVSAFLRKHRIIHLDEAAIEIFGGQRKNPMLKMMLASTAQGALIGYLSWITNVIVPIWKGNESKEVADASAQLHGLVDYDGNVADAVRIGELAGFCNAG